MDVRKVSRKVCSRQTVFFVAEDCDAWFLCICLPFVFVFMFRVYFSSSGEMTNFVSLLKSPFSFVLTFVTLILMLYFFTKE